MRIVWTDDALDDIEAILTHSFHEAGPRTAQAVERRVVGQIESLLLFPERTRRFGIRGLFGVGTAHLSKLY